MRKATDARPNGTSTPSVPPSPKRWFASGFQEPSTPISNVRVPSGRIANPLTNERWTPLGALRSRAANEKPAKREGRSANEAPSPTAPSRRSRSGSEASQNRRSRAYDSTSLSFQASAQFTDHSDGEGVDSGGRTDSTRTPVERPKNSGSPKPMASPRAGVSVSAPLGRWTCVHRSSQPGRNASCAGTRPIASVSSVPASERVGGWMRGGSKPCAPASDETASAARSAPETRPRRVERLTASTRRQRPRPRPSSP